MSELREYVPKYWKKLSDTVFERYKDKDDFYHSANSDGGWELSDLPLQRIGPVLRPGLPHGDEARTCHISARAACPGFVCRVSHRTRRGVVRQSENSLGPYQLLPGTLKTHRKGSVEHV